MVYGLPEVIDYQPLFDKVVDHLLTQKVPSLRVDDSGGCGYRGHNDCACAVGCIIPDDKYTPDLEGMSVPLVLDHIGLDVKYRWMFALLQDLHDNRNVWYREGEDVKFCISELKHRLEMIAGRLNLNTKEIYKER